MASFLTRRNVLQSSAVLVVNISGCASFDSSATESTTTDNNTTKPTTEKPTTTTIPDDQVAAYEELSEDSKALFRSALENGSIERPSDEIPNQLDESEYVEYDGTVYSVAITSADKMIAEYRLTLEALAESEIEDESKLIVEDELDADASEVLEQTFHDGEYVVRGEHLPEQLMRNTYVQYQGEYYAIDILQVDITIDELTVSELPHRSTDDDS